MTHLTRRQFIQNSAMVAAAWPIFGSAAASKSLPIGFSTLGCPGWEWAKILTFAQQHGFGAIELRGLQGTMDLPARPEFGPGRVAESKKEVAAHGLHISCVSSSANMHDTDPKKHEEQLADAGRLVIPIGPRDHQTMSARPLMRSSETVPQKRESQDWERLSPIMKYCPAGTGNVSGPTPIRRFVSRTVINKFGYMTTLRPRAP